MKPAEHYTTVTKHSFPYFLIVFLLMPLMAESQDAPGSLLPDIDPQDIEIRGDFVARFPGIMRQPILGFSPRPRVFQIDPNRMPFLESPEQVVASLPLSDLERPQPPQYVFYQRPEKFNVWSTTGIGSYMAPEVDLFLGIPVTPTTKVTGRLNMVSSGDYIEDDNQTSSFRNLEGGLNLVQYIGSKSRLDIGVNTRWDRNHLPATDYIGYLPFLFENARMIDWIIPNQSTPLHPDNNMLQYGANVSYRYDRNHITFLKIDALASKFEADILRPQTTVATDTATYRYRANETMYGGSIRKDIALRKPGNVLSLQAGANYASYDSDDILADEWMVSNAATIYRTRVLYNLRLSAGIRGFYAYDHRTEAKFYAYPELGALYNLTPDITLRADFSGFVSNVGMHGLNRTNRRLFAYNNPENERGIQFGASAEMNVYEGLKVQSGIKYSHYKRHAIYQLIDFTGMAGNYNDRLFLDINGTQDAAPNQLAFDHPYPLMSYRYIDGANLLRWEANVWYDLMPETFTIYGGVYAQWHADKEGHELPFRENIGAMAGGTYTFTKRSRAQIWADYVGSKFVDASMPDSRGYILLNARFDFWASREIGAYIKVTNLLDQRYTKWVGYDELPAQMYGGIMIKF